MENMHGQTILCVISTSKIVFFTTANYKQCTALSTDSAVIIRSLPPAGLILYLYDLFSCQLVDYVSELEIVVAYAVNIMCYQFNLYLVVNIEPFWVMV